MQFNEDQIVAWTRFLLDNGIEIKQVEGGLWKPTPTGGHNAIEGFDLTRAYPTYREAVLALARTGVATRVAA
jgi:hypothetical protein